MHRHALDEAPARNAPGSATMPINSAKATTCALNTPAMPNTDIFTTPMTIDTAASVAITPAPLTPAAISSDSRITPEPAVPPTTAP